MTRHYYVKIDKEAQKDHKSYGLITNKTAVALTSKQDAINFIKERVAYDLGCKMITREEAKQFRREFVELIPKIEFVPIKSCFELENLGIIIINKNDGYKNISLA